MEEQLRPIAEQLLRGNAPGTQEAVARALEAGYPAHMILHQALIPAMDEVGCRYEEGEFFVPEMLVAARAMKAALAHLKPHLVGNAAQPLARVAIGTVRGDLHDIGKNLVAMMLEGAGFQVDDLGTNVAPEQFVAAVQEDRVTMIGMSALLTTTMPMMRATIQALESAGVRQNVRVLVGGAPITEAYAAEIGADAYAADAGQVANLARQLLGLRASSTVQG